MIIGFDSFLNLISNMIVVSVINVVGILMIECWVSMIIDFVIVLMVVVVMLLMNVRIVGSLLYFLKYGVGSIVNR